MESRVQSSRSLKRIWAKPQSRVGRIAFWLSAAALVCLLTGAALGTFSGGLTGWAVFLFSLDTPFLFILLVRYINGRLLWKVRNRLIVTYLLMGLAPLVLFGNFIAIIGYGLAGQYSINSALASLDEAADQVKGETSDVAGTLNEPGFKPGSGPMHFEESSNPREAEISLAQLQNNRWHTVQLVSKRGTTPVSPFDGAGRPAWLSPGKQHIVVLNGRLYLCREAVLQEENRKTEVMGALELNHKALGSMVASLGRMLVFSGFSERGHVQIDKAEVQAKTAEQEADVAEQKQETARELQDKITDAQQQEEEARKDAEAAESQARQQVEQAQAEARKVMNRAGVSDGEKTEARQDLEEAQGSLKQAQTQVLEELQAAPKTGPSAVTPPQGTQRNGPRPHVAAGGPATDSAASRVGGPEATSPLPTDGSFTAVSGGTLRPPAHLFDQRVYFTAPLTITNWQDGRSLSAILVMISRPTLLYAHLFATSVDMGSLLRNVLVGVALFSVLLELLALWMALRLSRTITGSVAGLYRGTTEIDGGNLAYRVKLERKDQLGALANSFNTMAGSIEDLLVQQREKERLLSELAIAQEVQGNLFPHSPVSRPGLDLHAVCLPARSVSGDYFDFIFQHGQSICITLGDISGKGISAALLMASLHSAVRAFSLGNDSPTPSPAHLLSLVNQHLYSSTQANKYATLFLAFYHPESRRLIYANGGHLPPFLISGNGTVQRLEAGGSVVGLLDGLQYEEATVEMQPGDLLAVFSDGLTEPEQNGTEFGENRLLELISSRRAEPLPAIVVDTFKALQDWIGTEEQPDDMTLLLARQL